MIAIVKAKHWQIFVTLFGLQMIAQQIAFVSFLKNGSVNEIFIRIVIIIIYVLMLGWLLLTGIALNKRLHPSKKLNFYIPTIAGLLILGITSWLLFSIPSDQMFKILSFGVMVGIMLFIVACLVTCCSYTAKALKLNETQEEIDINDYFNYVLGFLFWPIGVWFVQPRINKLFAAEN
jgi:hypothetical protein